MGQVTALTAEKTLELFGETIVDAEIIGNNLIVYKASDPDHLAGINLGNVRGAAGPTGGVSLTDMNTAIANAIKHPGCKVRRTAVQAAADSNFVEVAFSAPDERDTDGFHTGSSTKVIIPAGLGGWYDVKAAATLVSGTAGWTAIVQINVGGAMEERLQRTPSLAGPTITLSGSTELALAAGAEVELVVYQDSGSSKNIDDAWMSLHRISA